MDMVLMAVTALSLSMAAGMAIIVAKLLRDERARSEARVAALGAMAAEPAAAARATLADDLELRPESVDLAGVGDLFAERDQPSPWGRRVAVIGMLAAAVVAFFLVFPPRPPQEAAPRPAVPAGAPQPEVAAPLELRALKHTEQAESFVVSGIVHNPRGSAPLTGVVATAFVFGADGGYLSSGRAPVDFTTLAPGAESPFVVTVPVTSAVARYRIGFRTEDGRVISHVDRRSPDALASK